jgi:hypothetical protein
MYPGTLEYGTKMCCHTVTEHWKIILEDVNVIQVSADKTYLKYSEVYSGFSKNPSVD